MLTYLQMTTSFPKDARKQRTNEANPRICLSILGLLLLVIVAGCGTGGGSDDDPDPGPGPGNTTQQLSVPFVAQQTPVWCWAACSEMIFRYYGTGNTQCQILSILYQGDCCSFPAFCQTTAPVAGIQAVLFQSGGLSSEIKSGPLSFQEVRTEIDAGRPFIIAYLGSVSGHVVVVFGYDASNQTLFIHDPLYGTFTVPYGATFAYMGQATWFQTIYRIQ